MEALQSTEGAVPSGRNAQGFKRRGAAFAKFAARLKKDYGAKRDRRRRKGKPPLGLLLSVSEAMTVQPSNNHE